MYDDIAMWVSRVGFLDVVGWYRKSLRGKVREFKKPGKECYTTQSSWLVSARRGMRDG